MSERPENLVYGFNDKPAFFKSILLGFQFTLSNFTSLSFVLIVMTSIHASSLTSGNILSVCMLIIGIISLLQSLKFRGHGAGLCAPPSVAPTYLAQSLVAVKLGGLPLLFGMTFFAGIIQTVLSFFVRFLKRIFPTEIASLILFLIGIDVGYLGVKFYIEAFSTPHLTHNTLFFITAFLPLVLILFFDQFFKGSIKLYSIALAVIISYLAIYFSNLMPNSDLQAIANAPWFHVMSFHFRYAFRWDLTVPFIIGAIVCVIKLSGAITALQEIQSKDIKQPDMNQISQGSIIDGFGTLIVGLLGGLGLNASSSVIALSLSKGITSRYIGFAIAGIMIVLSFVFKLALIFVFIPKVIMAAVLIELGVTLALSSVRMLMATLNCMRNFIIIGVAIVAGFSHSIYPDLYSQLPTDIKMFTGSSMILAAVVAIVLNFIFIKPKDSNKVY